MAATTPHSQSRDGDAHTRTAAVAVLASASEPLAAIALLLAPCDLLQLLLLSRGTRAALGALGAVRSVAFATRYIRGWVVRAVAPVLFDQPSLRGCTAQTVWDEVIRIWDAQPVGNYAKWTGSTLTISDLAAAIDDVQLFVDVRDELLRKGLPFDTISAGQGDAALLTLLIVNGAALEAKNVVGQRPIHLAEGAETARLLVVAGAETSPLDGFGRTPFQYADANGRVGPRRRNRDGRLLDFAVRQGNYSAVAALLRSGADPDSRDADGMTPLMVAARCGQYRAMRVLLEGGGADPESPRAKNGQRALHVAAIRGKIDVVRALLEGRADVMARDAGRPYTPRRCTGARAWSGSS
ncbi:hypothetical protein HK405_011916 [Cladochytrium tenue]|nr:hypothetical protein HK405_011916 [Cladochytrium tenue]